MVALLGGFATGSSSVSFAQSSDEEGVRAAASAFYAALNARDIKAMDALWAPDANVIMIHPGGPTARAPAVGPESVRQSWMRPWANLAEWSVTVNDLRVRVGQGWAVVLATTPVHAKMRDSDTVNDFLALATIVYEQREGRWLIVHQHVSQPPR
jgi:ketosteroid isomerase-like protein